MLVDDLLSRANFVELEKVAIRIIKEEHMPFTFTGETDGWGDKFYTRCL